MRHPAILAALALATTALLPAAPAAAQYTFQTFTLPSNSFVNAVNDNLAIAGYINGNNALGFVRFPSGISSQYNFPGSVSTYFLGYNNAQIAFGVAEMPNTTYIHFSIENGQVAVVNTQVPGVVGLNNLNNFVGNYANGPNATDVIQNLNGAAFTFPIATLTGQLSIGALSDNNDIVGICDGFQDGFLRTANGSVYTWTFPETDFMGVAGVNTAYNVTGNYTFGQDVYSGYVIGNGGVSSPLNVPGAIDTYIGGINNNGVIAGTAIMQANGAWVGFFAYPPGYDGVRSSAKAATVKATAAGPKAIRPAGLAAGLLTAGPPAAAKAVDRLLFRWPTSDPESPSGADAARVGAARRQALRAAAPSARRLVVKPPVSSRSAATKAGE